jgi:ribosomal protein S18 acetylase RimI-like enzyme
MSAQRTLNDSDYTICQQMLLDVFGPSELQQFTEAWRTRSKTASFASTTGTKVIGYILVDIHNKIQYLCVDPVFRNARLGSTLLRSALECLQSEGAREILLTTAKDSRLTVWYAKFGFTIVRNVYDAAGEFVGADMRFV